MRYQTEGAYLNRLGKILLRYFPAGQVREILEDYQEHFTLGRERGGTDEASISALGTPKAVTAEILREMPEGRLYFYRYTVCCGAVLLFTCYCFLLRYTYWGRLLFRNTHEELGTCFLMLLAAAAFFVLTHGWAELSMGSRFPQEPVRSVMAVYTIPPVVFCLTSFVIRYLLAAAENDTLPAEPRGIHITACRVLDFSTLVTLFLMIWSLWRSYSHSVRYFPAALHAAGALLSVREIERILHDMEMERDNFISTFYHHLQWTCPRPYCFGILLTLLFWCYIRGKCRGEKS